MNRKPRLKVRGPDGRRPFLRGMLTHSLLKNGLTFKEALATANLTRQRLGEIADASGRDLEISTEELGAFVAQLVGETYGADRMHAMEAGPYQAEPTILHPEGPVPFSRGLLSQKLIGTGLDPRLAYEVAQEVWSHLRRAPNAQITENELRRIERSIVVERHGEDFGRRYDAIDHIAQTNRPIIVLLGGATGCGKSTLATEIAYRLGIRMIASTDMIREIMRKLLSPDILPAIHKSSYAVKNPRDTSDAALAGFLEQAARVEVGVTASIRRAVVENFHLVVEGVHLVPPMDFAAEFESKANVIPIVLATLDRTVLESRYTRRGKEPGGSRRAKRYLDALDDILRIQDYILDRADQNGVPIIQNVSFDEAANDLLKLITDRIHHIALGKAAQG